ncbi:hypothetical protein ACIA8O_27025 [Kitasatospora sp. NPDC051853]|uniref:hypothetical protein n=1 Tax=Kitasatospora sp. NPDC051853 TaxID=3364058 RepID=UPI00378B4EA3
MSLDGLDAVAWDQLDMEHPADRAEDIPGMLRLLARKGAEATESDCHPLWRLATRSGRMSSGAAAALPFVIGLATDPTMGARIHLVAALTAMYEEGPADEQWADARTLLADPDPEVRRAAIGLSGGVPRLLERWRVETDPAVRLPVLIALGEATAVAGEGGSAVADARAVLAAALGEDDPVLWVAAVHASAGLDREPAVRQVDRLVEVFSDPALRPRFEEVWYQPLFDTPSTREDVVDWIAGRFEHDADAALSFALRLAGRAHRTGDSALCRKALDLAWQLLTEYRSVGAALLPLAGGLLDHPDGAVRLRAVNILAALGPAAAPYADRLAELLDDDGADADLDGTVREVARWALARIGDPRAWPGLVEQLRAQGEEQGRSYGTGDPRRPDIMDVLVPLRAHADVLLPGIAEAIRQGGARGGATQSFLEVLKAWGENAGPALPDLLPLLADTRTSWDVVRVLEAIGPAAAPAVPALRAGVVLDSPRAHWAADAAAMRIGHDRTAALAFFGDAVMAAEAPWFGPIGDLAGFGPEAAPYAERVRFVMEHTTHWPRLTAAVTLWSITGRAEPSMPVIEEFVLPLADGGIGFQFHRDALQALIRMGEISPAIRAALVAFRQSDRRLPTDGGYPMVLHDEELLDLAEQALMCVTTESGETG